jgi:chromosome segregation ATPase
MDYEKQIRILQNDNEFLEEQVAELTKELDNKNNQLADLTDTGESEASLRSKLNMAKYEIDQLKYNAEESAKKASNMDALFEETQKDFVREIRGRQKDQGALKELSAAKASVQLLNEEINEITALFKKNKELKKELTATKSLLSLMEMDCKFLKDENIELKAQVNQLIKKA